MTRRRARIVVARLHCTRARGRGGARLLRLLHVSVLAPAGAASPQPQFRQVFGDPEQARRVRVRRMISEMVIGVGVQK
eukprot:6386967-Pyramimonas_sp.AAC.1